MTIIGKILTFLIFVFSLLFLGFAIIINQTNKDPRTRESWYSVALRLQKKEQSYVEDLKSKDEELAALRSQNVVLQTAVDSEKKRAEQLSNDLNTKVSIAENAARTATDKFQQSQIAINAAQADLARMRDDVSNLSERLKTKDQQITDTQQKLVSERNTRVATQIERDTLRERLAGAEKQNVEFARIIDEQRENALRSTSPGEATKPQPPPNDVQGAVTAITDAGYISINKGSDHGLAKGQTLEVYRMSPKPEYVGLMRLLSVNNHEAVGIIVEPRNRKVTVLKGDLVGSSILPTGR